MDYKKKLFIYVLIAMLVPPSGWIFNLWFTGLARGETFLKVLMNPIQVVYFIIATSAMLMFFLSRLNKIEYYISQGANNNEEAAALISRMPYYFIIGEFLYNFFGPMSGMLGVPHFEIFDNFLLGEILALPNIFLFLTPFFVFFC